MRTPITHFLPLCLLTAMSLTACSQGGETPPPPPAPAPDLVARARELAQEILIVDTHVDAPYRYTEKPGDVTVESPDRNFDYPRAQAGGLDAAFMSIYVPADEQTKGGGGALADSLIDWVEGLVTQAPDKFALARSPQDVEATAAQGKVALPMGMENGAPIVDLPALQHFFDRGIRYITLTHSQNNLICDSSYATERQWQGLSPYGREVVAEMNRLGVMIDISHVSDQTFDQVIELSKAPVIASHSSCRHFTPGWERNLDDERIKKLGEKGGVIQINFGSSFLTQAANENGNAYWTAMREHAEKNQLAPGSPEMEKFREQYLAEHPPVFADLSDVVAHVDHVVKLAGVDHVGFGSDFDGVGDSLPTGLKDVSQYPNLIRALLEKGYSEDDVRKIAGGNLMRVWREVERVAAEIQTGSATNR